MLTLDLYELLLLDHIRHLLSLCLPLGRGLLERSDRVEDLHHVPCVGRPERG